MYIHRFIYTRTSKKEGRCASRPCGISAGGGAVFGSVQTEARTPGALVDLARDSWVGGAAECTCSQREIIIIIITRRRRGSNNTSCANNDKTLFF